MGSIDRLQPDNRHAGIGVSRLCRSGHRCSEWSRACRRTWVNLVLRTDVVNLAISVADLHPVSGS
ncbi:MAG: hypothetical protein IPG76_22340 [Acidobacteria bacterium]|nr:hypothetical protein [Acidobacteriota bacterium]